jgi:hypothetical protein
MLAGDDCGKPSVAALERLGEGHETANDEAPAAARPDDYRQLRPEAI